jgi:hypothetical protein
MVHPEAPQFVGFDHAGEILNLRHLQDGAQRLHRSPCARTARYADQGELGPPGLVRTNKGGERADLDIKEGGKTSAWLATLPAASPSGGFFHLGQALPW